MSERGRALPCIFLSAGIPSLKQVYLWYVQKAEFSGKGTFRHVACASGSLSCRLVLNDRDSIRSRTPVPDSPPKLHCQLAS